MRMQISFTTTTSFLALWLLAQCISGTEANSCSRELTRSQRNPLCNDYITSYDSYVELQHKIQDGIDTQLQYIYRADENETGDNYDKLHKLFFPGRTDRTLTDAITSLVKLNELRDKAQEFGIEGQHSDAVLLLYHHVLEDTCQWRRNQNISVGDCTNNTLLHQLLDQLQNRLHFIQVLEEAKKMMRNVPGADCGTTDIDYCAWMHHTVLNECQNSVRNNTKLFDSLDYVCRTNKLSEFCKDKGLNLCPA